MNRTTVFGMQDWCRLPPHLNAYDSVFIRRQIHSRSQSSPSHCLISPLIYGTNLSIRHRPCHDNEYVKLHGELHHHINIVRRHIVRIAPKSLPSILVFPLFFFKEFLIHELHRTFHHGGLQCPNLAAHYPRNLRTS